MTVDAKQLFAFRSLSGLLDAAEPFSTLVS